MSDAGGGGGGGGGGGREERAAAEQPEAEDVVNNAAVFTELAGSTLQEQEQAQASKCCKRHRAKTCCPFHVEVEVATAPGRKNVKEKGDRETNDVARRDPEDEHNIGGAGAAELEEPPPKKLRRASSNEKCAGLSGYWDPLPGKRLRYKQHPPTNHMAHAPCTFNTKVAGVPAQVQPTRGQSCCMFCDAKQMETALGTPRGRTKVTRCLKAFKQKSEADYKAALERLPEKYRKTCGPRVEAAIKRATDKQGPIIATTARERTARRKEGAATSWNRALVARQRCMAKPQKQKRREFKKFVADDQRRCWNKFFPTGEQAVKRASRIGLKQPTEKLVDDRRAAAEETMTHERGARFSGTSSCISCCLIEMLTLHGVLVVVRNVAVDVCVFRPERIAWRHLGRVVWVAFSPSCLFAMGIS